MRTKTKVFGLGLAVFLCLVATLGGCPATSEYPAVASWIRIIDMSGNDVTASSVPVCQGQSVTFRAEGSDDIAFFGWRIEMGDSGRDEDFGDKWSSTFTGEIGDHFTVTIRGYFGSSSVVLEQSFVAVIVDGDACHTDDGQNDGGGGTLPPDPIIDLKVNGADGPVECQADANGHCAFHVSWETGHAVRVEVSGASNFHGERSLMSASGGELLTLGVGTWTLVATAIGPGSTIPDSDQVMIIVRAHSDPPPSTDRLRISSVTLSPEPPYVVGQQTIVTVVHTGSGLIRYKPVTSLIDSVVTAEADGQTTFIITWPLPAAPSDLFFTIVWPDGHPEEVWRFRTPVYEVGHTP